MTRNQSHVFPRHTKADLPTVAGGDGPYLIDTTGKRYLDACGGAAVSCLGHSAREVKQPRPSSTEFLTPIPASSPRNRPSNWPTC